jgi:hypothetical protein
VYTVALGKGRLGGVKIMCSFTENWYKLIICEEREQGMGKSSCTEFFCSTIKYDLGGETPLSKSTRAKKKSKK